MGGIRKRRFLRRRAKGPAKRTIPYLPRKAKEKASIGAMVAATETRGGKKRTRSARAGRGKTKAEGSPGVGQTIDTADEEVPPVQDEGCPVHNNGAVDDDEVSPMEDEGSPIHNNGAVDDEDVPTVEDGHLQHGLVAPWEFEGDYGGYNDDNDSFVSVDTGYYVPPSVSDNGNEEGGQEANDGSEGGSGVISEPESGYVTDSEGTVSDLSVLTSTPDGSEIVAL